MKIEHTTYDTTRRRRSMARRASDASAKIKNYISTHFSRHADAKDPRANSAQRPTTFWPQYEAETSVLNPHSDMTAYLTQHHRLDKTARKDEKLIISANSSGRYLPLSDTHGGTVADDAPAPTLRRKAKFVKENGNIKSIDSHARPRTADDKIQMEKLKRLRQAMREGRMEQVVPPPQLSQMERRPAPPPTFAPPTESSRGRSSSRHATPSHTPHVSQHHRTKSSSRVKEYIRTSVEYVDEKTKEVKGKFKAPFEHLNYPSFPSSRRSSFSSEESFYCVGENKQAQKSNTQAIHELKARQYEATNERRLSGSGSSPWAHHAPDNCKLYHTFGATSIEGLCQKCESDFYRRKAQEQNSDSEYEDDLRPTPPLKDAKILSMRKQPVTQHYFQVETESLEDVGETVALKDISSRPIFNPVPIRQFSQKAIVVDNDDIGRTQTQKMVEQWSTRYGDDAPYVEEKDTAPLLRSTKGFKKGSSRDTEFYGFYDDVLDGQ
ncbi:hypothetical protein L207DRAFT_570329 [Hyaloscypha variabilis F]|uniref:Uncharacterized protein n=1 Tax=Hyaloscypha variabilis (strain UAMH 11265 / GT02V1 / F) TaxID=1149755 RepID=A0A2J6R844_HYAVF|nr:hypothetical protein L207DRAFT_570329 [Hyaloscypha variabilis F]